MHVVGAIEIAGDFAGKRPVAFVCGDPPRVLVSAGWKARLTRGALEMWGECQAGGIVERDGLTGFPSECGDDGAGLGVLVVASVRLDAGQQRDLLALARMMERMNASLLANLLRRLQEGDPSARRDLHLVMREHNYNVVQAARSLGMARATLYKYVRRLKIPIARVPAALREADEGDDHDIE